MTIVQWKIRAIRGATTVTANTIEAIREAVTELLKYRYLGDKDHAYKNNLFTKHLLIHC